MATTNKKAPVRKSNTRYASSTKTTKARPKSRTGSSSLARSSKSSLFTKRNGLIAAGMAAIAGLAFVALSFASGAPKYQYSFSTACVPKGGTTTTPAPTDAEQLKAQQACYDDSAEGLTYRVYKGVFNREPNAGEYAYWVQQLAGDRVQGTTFVGKMIASNGAVVPKTATDAEFITGLYKNMLLRTDDKITVDKKGTDYWAKKMQGAKKWSRTRVAYHFATTSESKRANAGTFVTYISNATPVVIKENAKEAQAARLVQMKKYATTAGTNATAAKKAENAAKSALGTAKASSSLEAIGANKATATAEAAKARTAMRAAKKAADSAARLKKRADALVKYATDLKTDAGATKPYAIKKISDVYALVKASSKGASTSASNAGKTIGQIDAAYAARQAKIAEEAAAAAKVAEETANAGGGGGTPAEPAQVPGCDKTMASIISSMANGTSPGTACIKRAQTVFRRNSLPTGGVDGQWGDQTRRSAVLYQAAVNDPYKTPTGECKSTQVRMYHGPENNFVGCKYGIIREENTVARDWMSITEMKTRFSCPALYAYANSNPFSSGHKWRGISCKANLK